MKSVIHRTNLVALIAVLGVVALFGTVFVTQATAAPASRSGTTLSAYKTIDICELPDGKWQYSGEISVWNEGTVDTQGFTIQDCIQNKTGSGQFVDVYCAASFDPPLTMIPVGTTQLTALTTRYTIVGAPLDGYIRNRALLTITNNSGSFGTPKGPEPKATWLGEVAACPVAQACGWTLQRRIIV